MYTYKGFKTARRLYEWSGSKWY